jgi:hypothetical protein
MTNQNAVSRIYGLILEYKILTSMCGPEYIIHMEWAIVVQHQNETNFQGYLGKNKLHSMK